MKDDQEFTQDELKLMAELADEALDDPAPTRTAEEIDRRLDELYERTLRERRRIA